MSCFPAHLLLIVMGMCCLLSWHRVQGSTAARGQGQAQSVQTHSLQTRHAWLLSRLLHLTAEILDLRCNLQYHAYTTQPGIQARVNDQGLPWDGISSASAAINCGCTIRLFLCRILKCGSGNCMIGSLLNSVVQSQGFEHGSQLIVVNLA